MIEATERAYPSRGMTQKSECLISSYIHTHFSPCVKLVQRVLPKNAQHNGRSTVSDHIWPVGNRCPIVVVLPRPRYTKLFAHFAVCMDSDRDPCIECDDTVAPGCKVVPATCAMLHARNKRPGAVSEASNRIRVFVTN